MRNACDATPKGVAPCERSRILVAGRRCNLQRCMLRDECHESMKIACCVCAGWTKAAADHIPRRHGRVRDSHRCVYQSCAPLWQRATLTSHMHHVHHVHHTGEILIDAPTALAHVATAPACRRTQASARAPYSRHAVSSGLLQRHWAIQSGRAVHICSGT